MIKPKVVRELVHFEGTEGSGKSTACAATVAMLRSYGYVVTATKEPGGSHLGAALRQLALHDHKVPVSELALHYLMLADRAQHMDELVIPRLQGGGMVVTDRGMYSSLAYQAGGSVLDAEMVYDTNLQAMQGVLPGMVVYCVCDPEERTRRLGDRETLDKIEAKGPEYFARVDAAYEALYQESLQEGYTGPLWLKLDCTSESPEQLAAKVVHTFQFSPLR